MPRFIGFAPLLILALGLLGCGGDDNGTTPAGPAPPGPSPDNATITGRLVEADHVTIPLTRAEVSEPTTGQSTESNATTGIFTLRGLPAGNVQLNIVSTHTPAYASATLTIPTQAGKTTNVTIAVLPTAIGTPTSLFISPSGTPSPNVEIGGVIQFGASVYVKSARQDVQPTWLLTGDAVGTIDANGLFTATKAGTALVTALAGNLSASTGLIVVGSRPPIITSVLVSASDDLPLPASGGSLMVTAAINDGEGIRDFDSGSFKGLKFEFYTPDGGVFELTPGAPIHGTDKDGTWQIIYSVPANSNTPASDGTQAPQFYQVRVAARDLTGLTTYSNFYEFKVLGLESPPPPGP